MGIFWILFSVHRLTAGGGSSWFRCPWVGVALLCRSLHRTRQPRQEERLLQKGWLLFIDLITFTGTIGKLHKATDYLSYQCFSNSEKKINLKSIHDMKCFLTLSQWIVGCKKESYIYIHVYMLLNFRFTVDQFLLMYE